LNFCCVFKISLLLIKEELQSMLRHQTPPFYNVHDDDFYHGPAWVIKPRLFQPKEKLAKTPGPSYYHIPDRSIYDRPGKTIGNRYETPSPVSLGLLAHYSPNDHYTSNAKMPAISITPRRIERMQGRGYSQHLYPPSDRTIHSGAPLLRPLYGPIISRKSLDHKSSNSPGPAAYPMYKFDEDILPRSQSGITQKHRFSSNRTLSTLQTNPPFYYPKKFDRHRLPSFTIGRRMCSPKKINQYTAPYYSSFDNQTQCSSVIKPGVTLKGRWSPFVSKPKSSNSRAKTF
jgi:hypothetical protein